MKLKEIVIHNFMPYKGKQKVEFPQHETQNVMLLFGDNMRGKTSFLNSIRWGFYGVALGRHLREIPRVNLVNMDASAEGDWSMSILLKFTHENKDYELRRKITKKNHVSQPKNDNDFEEIVGLKIDGEAIYADLIVNEINQVTPEEISRFFLFDGELLQEYENLLIDQDDQGKKIKAHIEQALGVPALLNGKNEFSKLLQDARRLQTRDAKNTSDLKSYAEQQRQLSIKQTTIENDLTALGDQKNETQSQVDDIDDKLKNTKAAQKKKIKLDILSVQKSATEDQLDDDANEQRVLLKNAWKDVLFSGIQPLLASLKKKRTVLFQASQNRAILKVKIGELKNSLDDTTCLTCSQVIPESQFVGIRHQIEELRAEAELSVVNLDDISLLDSKIDKLSKINSSAEGKRICCLVVKQRKHQVHLIKLETEIDEIEEEIKDYDTDQMMCQRQMRDRFISQLANMKIDIQKCDKDLEKNKAEQTQISNIISKSTGGKGKLSSIRVDVYQYLEMVFKTGIDQLRDSLREQVADYASTAFSKLTTEKTYAGLDINKNYGLSIIDQQGRTLKERSAGAEQIVALSLIDGLSKTARKTGPIVMDTPLGRLDPKHRSNVLKYLPNMADQVILLVHEGEIDPDKDLINIAERIGARYQINRISATESRIERSK